MAHTSALFYLRVQGTGVFLHQALPVYRPGLTHMVWGLTLRWLQGQRKLSGQNTRAGIWRSGRCLCGSIRKGTLIWARLQNQQEPENELDTPFFNNENNQVMGNIPKVLEAGICLRTQSQDKDAERRDRRWKGELMALAYVVCLLQLACTIWTSVAGRAK